MHDNSVCACAVSAWILLPVINLSLEMDSATSISYVMWKVLPFNAAFVYFGDFSVHTHSFDHITTSGLNLTSYFNSGCPFSNKDATPLSATFMTIMWQAQYKYTNCTSRCKYLTKNAFTYIDFPYDVGILAVRRCFSPIVGDFSLRMRSFDHLYYFWFKIWRYTWIQRTRFPIKTRSFRARDTISATFVTIILFIYLFICSHNSFTTAWHLTTRKQDQQG